jgi:hypothetical protein
MIYLIHPTAYLLYYSQMTQIYRAVARRDNWGGGGVVYSYIHVHYTVKTIAFKRNPSGRTRIYEYTPPPHNYRSSYVPPNRFYSDKNINFLINTPNHELVKVASWLRANKLTLHPDKTKFIVFHPSRKKHQDELKINGHVIERVSQTIFWGITIQETLSRIPHIQSITTKISKNIGIIAQSRHSLDRSTLSVLYNSLILSYLQYCTIIWGSSYTTHLHPLLRCQKKS